MSRRRPRTAPTPADAQRSGEGFYPGSELGLPAAGRGSVAGWGARIAAFLIDLAIAALAGAAIAAAVGIRPHGRCPAPSPHAPVVCASVAHAEFGINVVQSLAFVVITVLSLALSGRTFGMRLTGLQVVRLDGRRLGWSAVVRTVLLVLILPALISDPDRRGWHDRAANAVVVAVR